MDDWKEAVFSNRHVHNRVGKQGKGKGGKSNGPFNVHRAFGSYEIQCPAANKLATSAGDDTAKLEIYNLNDTGNALVGGLILPSVLQGTVLMTGSRKVMNSVIRALEQDVETSEQTEEAEASDQKRETANENEGDVENDVEEDDDDRAQHRIQEFEKNSFRSPKFWVKWQGHVTYSLPETIKDTIVTDSGYVVFSGNDCGKFDGTLSCDALGWSNVKISGRKTASKSARDFSVEWLAVQE